MESDLRAEINWLEDRIKTLEDYIRKLEFENHKLKQTIGHAIHSLEAQNSKSRKVIHGQPIPASIVPSTNFKSYLVVEEAAENEDDDSVG